MSKGLSYDAVGATQVHAFTWDERPAGYRRFERSVTIGRGPCDWEAAAAAVARWEVKIRSGFDIQPLSGDLEVSEGADYELIARIGPLRIREPARVVQVVRTASTSGFAYGTRPGHPVSGEEAFIVRRSADDTVSLTLRSLTRPAPGWRRLLFPAALIAQRIYRRRYLRALTF